MASIIKQCKCSDQQRCQHGWTVRYRVNGKQAQETFQLAAYPTAAKALAAAKDFKLKTEHDQRAGSFLDPSAGDVTFRECAESWLAQHNGTDRTSAVYSSALRNHIYPAIGDTPIRKITRPQVRTLLRETMPASVGSSVVSTARQVISAVLAEALADKRIAENVATGIKLDKVQTAINPDDLAKLMPTREQLDAIAAGLPPDWSLLVYLMRYCGLRSGEAFAVKGSCVSGNVLRITEQYIGNTYKTGPLKHRKTGDFREVPLPTHVARRIAGHVAAFGCGDGYLFTRTNQTSFRQNFGRQAAKQKMPAEFTPHTLRHVYVSQLLAAGVPITEVARYLGHSDINITFAVYGNLPIPSSFDRAIEVLDKL